MNYLRLLFLTLLIFTFSSFNNKEVNSIFTVVIDPGHGGHDTGAIGYNAIKEKKINLGVALITRELIKKYDSSIRVVLTRQKDVFIALKDRARIAKAFNADLYISLHCDANNNVNAKGLTLYLQKPKIKNNTKRIENYKIILKFALLLDEILNNKLKIKSNGIKFNNYSVLRNTINDIPSILVEMGFITNEEEANYFKRKGQIGTAYALTQAIIKFKKVNDL